MILICIQQTGDVQLARAFVAATHERFTPFLLFSRSELATLFGDVRYKHSFDPSFCLLNPQNFNAVVSFSGPRDPRLAQNLFLLSYFNEIGIPTIEIQHGLFQYGINNTDVALQTGTRPERGDVIGLDMGYAARHLISWAGENGIGYLKSELDESEVSSRGDFVLIMTNNNWHVYGGKERQQLAFAILELANAFPAQRFVWKPHHAENAHVEAKRLHAIATEFEVPNLVVESGIPAERLIPHCSAAISTVSTTLVDLELRQKPTLVFESAPVAHLTAQLHATTFRSGAELVSAFARLQADPTSCLIRTGVSRLDADALRARVAQAVSERALSPNFLPIALRYLPELRGMPSVAMRADTQRLTRDINRLAEKLGVIHRSMLAYKAKRFVKRLRGLSTPDIA